MAIIDKSSPWDESIAFVISPEGEIRSLKSPPPFPCRRCTPSPTGGCASPPKKKVPHQDLRRINHEIRNANTHHSGSESSSTGFSDDNSEEPHLHHFTPHTSVGPISSATNRTGDNKSGTPKKQQEEPVTHIALQIAQSTIIQCGLQRRYWDPPISPTHLGSETDQPITIPRNVHRTVALTDINISGDPVRMCSADFDSGPRGLKVGTCLFLNLPYGANDACGLHIKMKDGTEDQPRFILEVAASVLDACTGKKRWRLCTHHDVTDIINDMARKHLASEKPTSNQETPAQSFTPKVHFERPSTPTGSDFFDWTAFAEEELDGLLNTPQPTGRTEQHTRPTSLPPSHRSRQSRFHLSGSTLVPSTRGTPDSSARTSARFSTRSTVVDSSPTPLSHKQRVPRNHPRTPPMPPSPLFESVPQDIQSFLSLGDSIRRAHAGLFFVLVPLRKSKHHGGILSATRGGRNLTIYNMANLEYPPSRHRLVAPNLLGYSIEFVSAELHEAPEILGKLVKAGNAQDGNGRKTLDEGLRRGNEFLWKPFGKRERETRRGKEYEDGEAEREDWWAECVPVGDGGKEKWWACFISG